MVGLSKLQSDWLIRILAGHLVLLILNQDQGGFPSHLNLRFSILNQDQDRHPSQATGASRGQNYVSPVRNL